jgi:hypothetical protein
MTTRSASGHWRFTTTLSTHAIVSTRARIFSRSTDASPPLAISATALSISGGETRWKAPCTSTRRTGRSSASPSDSRTTAHAAVTPVTTRIARQLSASTQPGSSPAVRLRLRLRHDSKSFPSIKARAA